MQKMTNPYELHQNSPETYESIDLLRRRRRFWLSTIGISFAGVIVPPIIGLIGTIFNMRGAFFALGTSGIGDPAELSRHIGEVLVYTATGLVISVIFVIVLIGVLIRFFTLPKVRDLSPHN